MRAAAFLAIAVVGGAAGAASARIVAPQPARGGTAQGHAARAASPEVEDFVRQAIEDRFRADDIPDLTLLDDRTHVPVLKVMPHAGLQLSARALPAIDGTTFELIGPDEAKVRAARTRTDVAYLMVDDARIAGDTASVRLGADLVMPAELGAVKTCCCVGLAEFKRSEGSWVFVKWRGMTCA